MITACLYPHMLTPHTAQLVRYVAYRFELPERRTNVRGGLVILARLRSRGCLVVVALCDMCYLNDIGLRTWALYVAERKTEQLRMSGPNAGDGFGRGIVAASVLRESDDELAH